MPEINMVFELKNKNALNQVAHTLQDRISAMDTVQKVQATPETPEQMRMTGVEIAAAIGVTVVVLRSGTELLEGLQKFVKQLKSLMTEIHDLKKVYVELGSRRVPVDWNSTDSKLLDLVAESFADDA